MARAAAERRSQRDIAVSQDGSVSWVTRKDAPLKLDRRSIEGRIFTSTAFRGIES